MVDALREMAGLLALVAVVLSVIALIVAARRRGAPVDEAAARIAPDPVLDQLLASQMQRLDRIGDEVMAQAGRLRMIEGNARHMVQRVGIVRFNPFEETGGNQSFALALLDADGDGWVLSSLHARSGTRVYAKAIAKGRSEAALSDEEAAAIRQATA
jgi:hypothetical protein